MPLTLTPPPELGQRVRARVGGEVYEAQIVAIYFLEAGGRVKVRLDGMFSDAGNPWRFADEVEPVTTEAASSVVEAA